MSDFRFAETEGETSRESSTAHVVPYMHRTEALKGPQIITIYSDGQRLQFYNDREGKFDWPLTSDLQ